MPTWLVHGFRWPRVAIRIHIILENLEDCAAEWLMAPATTAQLTQDFRKQFPEQLAHLPSLRFIEQYDPDDEFTKDQPYAYVCDQVTEIKLGVDIDEVRGVGVQSDTWSAIVELRDKIAPGENVGWFVVVNGDVERWAPPLSDDEGDEDTETELSENGNGNGNGNGVEESPVSSVSQRSNVPRSDQDETGKRRVLKKWFGKIRRARR
ncbi:hypothetical protein P171DRAFT_431082 [Karstenula rhodostoma CBS 690.94]|uniref:Developmental regulator protein n=1 Tax=Karstenula rhodostoma CBS 690.94 TaxID=1392251 RepID=A0A9P4UCX1_9PLEO|nr:hypothetical protein P171DRAFT_431082 [Karstenula rhodostoma CBS 690.94]